LPVVIGLNYSMAFVHDSVTAVVLDGKLIFAAEEERYTRHKHAVGELSYYSLIDALKFLSKFGLKPTDINAFALNYDARYFTSESRFLSYVLLFRSYLVKVYIWSPKEAVTSLTHEFIHLLISHAASADVGQNSLVQMSLFDRPAIRARPRSTAAVSCHPGLRQDACLPASLCARYRGPERPPSFHHDLLADPGIRTLEFEACGYDFVCSHSCIIGSTNSRLAIHWLGTRNRHVVGKRRTELCPTPL